MGRTESIRSLLLPFCLLVALGIFPSCTSMLGGKAEIQQKRRFTIVAEPIRRYLEESDRPYSATVQLRTFDIAGSYNQSEIVSRSSLYELQRNSLYVWGQRPRDMITDVVLGYLKDAQLFTRLVTERALLDERPEYVLSGTIKALERFDSGDRWFARLLLSMQLERQEDGQVIWRGEITANDELEVFNSDMEYTIQSLSEILRRRMERFIREIDFLFLNMGHAQNGVSLGLLAPSDSTDSALPDSTESEREIPSYFELIPGKLAPE
jgi:hypothetical protein